MRTGKVEISGIDTAKLKTYTEGEKRELLLRARGGDTTAREALVVGNLRLVFAVKLVIILIESEFCSNGADVAHL